MISGIVKWVTGDDKPQPEVNVAGSSAGIKDRGDSVLGETTRQDAITEANNETKGRSASVAKQATTLQYPQNIGTEYQPHSVIFYINARSNSAVGQASISNNAKNRDWINAQNNLTDTYSKENRAKSEQADTVLGMATGLAAAGAVTAFAGQVVGKNASKAAIPIVMGVAAGVAGGTVGALVDTTTTVRLLTAIQLLVQASPTAAYTANWQEDQLGAMMGVLGSGRASLDDIKGGGEYLARGMIGAAANLPKELGIGTENISGAIEATTKKVSNPYKEQLFKSMGFRKFSFEYRFAPANRSEYENVAQIIKEFRYHMHPDKGEAGFFLIYPSEFNIEYRYKEGPNNHINKISSCVLTDMVIKYGGADGVFNTIAGTDGVPAEINISLSFTELETLTADRIEDGL